MPAYVISEVEFLDPALVENYRSIAAATIAQFGGRYIVRSGAVEPVEGIWEPEKQLVVVEFPSMQRAREWYHSPEYAQALKIRQTALDRRLFFVEGSPGDAA
jgi:uncharacterized protein (DUF1330 family)